MYIDAGDCDDDASVDAYACKNDVPAVSCLNDAGDQEVMSLLSLFLGLIVLIS